MSSYEININPSEVDPDGTEYKGKFGKHNKGAVSSWNDLTDRPFYTEHNGVAELLPETKAIPGEDGDGGMFIITGNVPKLVIGESYTVKYNGAEYTCVAQDASTLAPNGVGVGNGTSFGLSGNNEPFGAVIGDENGQPVMMILPLDGATEVTISITGNGEVIHKLDNKYLDLDWLPVANQEVIIPETTISDSQSAEIPDTAGAISSLADGQTVIVEINGTSYLATRCSNMDGYYIAAYGSVSEEVSGAGPDAIDGKYLFGQATKSRNCYFISSEVGTYTCRVLGENKNKMPKEFLPDNVATKEWVMELLQNM